MSPKKSDVRLINARDGRGYTYAEIGLDALVPDPENPRIPLQESALDTILALIIQDGEGLFSLAQDIVEMSGTNPAELLNVTPMGDSFLVKEGNRRIAARKLLRNPEQLRDHVSDNELQRWIRLSHLEKARQLPTTILAVIGDSHDEWVNRRRLGPQGGVGVAQWGPQAKARREERTRGKKDRALSLIDALKATYRDRFTPLEPPPRTFTTFTRVIETPEARAHIGIDVDEQGNVMLTRGERSLGIVEEILADLRKSGEDKLTSRRIHTKDQILAYLRDVEDRLHGGPDDSLITLSASGATGKATARKTRTAQPRALDILKSLTPPEEPRLQKIYAELKLIRKAGADNASMVLTRVLLELWIDYYADRKSLPIAGDKNDATEVAVREFLKTLSVAEVEAPKAIREALKNAAFKSPSLSEKLLSVVTYLMAQGAMNQREGNAKARELKANDVVPLLNDAVHRLRVAPSMARVDHILEVVCPILVAMSK